MKIIEGLKSIKELQVKVKDLTSKVGTYSAHLNIETPTYPDQKGQVLKWLQAIEDLTKEIADLHVRLNKTNVMTKVKIKIGSNVLEKSITEWIIRRRLLASMDQNAWLSLTDRGLKEGAINSTSGGEPTKVTIVRCYDPVQRDEKVALFKSEPNAIDVALETVNATVDLLD